MIEINAPPRFDGYVEDIHVSLRRRRARPSRDGRMDDMAKADRKPRRTKRDAGQLSLVGRSMEEHPGRPEIAREKQALQPAGPTEALLPPDSFEPPERTPFAGVDRAFKANLARLTQGITPGGVVRTYFDWLIHLTLAPGKQLQLIEKAWRKATRLAAYAANAAADPNAPPCIEPLPQDRRFREEGWRAWPYNLICQSFLLNQQWWHNATTDIDGLSARSQAVVSFITRQLLDTMSPSNFLWTSPEITHATLEQGGTICSGALRMHSTTGSDLH